MKDMTEVGREILTASRNQLYMSLPYLDAALWALAPAPGLAALTKTDFARLDDTAFRERFAHSPLRRAGADGLKANLALWD